MQESSKNVVIQKVAVLGAGVMGAQIAAHCVNAGIETVLFDLKSTHGRPNALIEKALTQLTKLKPTPLATPECAALIQAKNYDDDLAELGSCDLIIEAIAERLDWKEALYQRIAPHLHENALLVSNTSGLSINTLAEVLPETLKHRFCGVHFFNPPRYMHLAELIPTATTTQALAVHLETWLTRQLGKCVVVANDTPNFIANRIGVFSLLVTLHHAQALNIGLDEVDALTGPLLGRPKSATLRTMDVVGLDTMAHVVHTMHQQLTDDPWHSLFSLPQWLTALITKGHLGQKTGQGIYRKQGHQIEVFDLETNSYRPAHGQVSETLMAIMRLRDPKERMQALLTSNDKQALFLAACWRDLFHYCAFHLHTIAHTVRDVDLAMRYGFGWQEGPFETWQQAGIDTLYPVLTETRASVSRAPLPKWLTVEHLFYTEQGAFCPQTNTYQPKRDLPVYQHHLLPETMRFERAASYPVLFDNDGVTAQIIDDIAIVSFKSKANTVSNVVLDGLEQVIGLAEAQCRGLVLYQQSVTNFSSGADLGGVASLIKTNQFSALDEMISHFQRVALRLKYSAIPTIAAVRGRALGGGCELMMHCDAVVAAFEAYPGLVELGVGLIPAGGGCKEMARRAASQTDKGAFMNAIQASFQHIASATVASSAPDAQRLGFLTAKDCWVMHPADVLYAAIAQVKALNAANYQPPLKTLIKVAGRTGHAKLQAGLANWLAGGFISAHDYYLANTLASVICGGEVNAGDRVDEQWLLQLERQAFIELAATPLTQARIAHLLETGKPLRN